MSEHLENQNGQEAAMQEEPSSAERCLTFESGGLLLFLSTKYVTEIINGHSITHLPLVPPFVKGIINLRGRYFLLWISAYAWISPKQSIPIKPVLWSLTWTTFPWESWWTQSARSWT